MDPYYWRGRGRTSPLPPLIQFHNGFQRIAGIGGVAAAINVAKDAFPIHDKRDALCNPEEAEDSVEL